MKEAEEELENELEFDTLEESNPAPPGQKDENQDGEDGKDVEMDFEGKLENIEDREDKDEDENEEETPLRRNSLTRSMAATLRP